MQIRRLKVSEFRVKLADVLEDTAYDGNATIVERRGRGVAILVPLSWFEDHRDENDPSAATIPVPPVVAGRI